MPIHRERHSRAKRWGETTKTEARLSDADITEFVAILKPIAFHVCFSRIGILHAIGVFQLLSALRSVFTCGEADRSSSLCQRCHWMGRIEF